MTLFAKHVAAARAQSRVAVNLRAESEGEIDPLNGVVADAPVETEVDAGPAAAPAGDDLFAEQRERLNRQHGMIRNRMRSEAVEETPAVVEETPVEEVPVEAPAVEDVIVEEPAAEVPAEEVIVEPVIEEPIVTAEELAVEEPAAEEVVVEEPAVEETPVEDIVADVPAEEIAEAPVEAPAEAPAEEVAEEIVPAVEVPAEEVAPAVEGEEIVPDVAPEAPVDVLPTPEELPAEEAVVDAAPVVEDAPVVEEEIVADVPAEEAMVETPVEDVVAEPAVEPAAEEVIEEPALNVTAEGEFSDRPVNENIGDEISEPDTNSLPEVDGQPVVDIPDSNDVDFTSEAAPAIEDGEVIDHDDSDVVFDSEEEAAAAEEAEAEDAADADAADSALEALEGEVAGLEALEREIDMLSGASVAIESFGINPSALAIMQTTGLLDGTALESLGLESISFHGSRDAESEMALEALTDKIKDKAASWSAKILSVTSAVGTKALSVIEPLWAKVSGAVSALSTAAWDKAAAAGKAVKAHPYKTIAAVIAAIAAVAGIATFVGSGLPTLGAKGPAVASFLKSLKSKIDAINWPFGKISAALSEGGDKIAVAIKNTAGAAKAATIGKLGWTQTAVKAAGGQIDRVYSAVKVGAGAFGARANKVGRVIGEAYVDTRDIIGNASKAAGRTVYEKGGKTQGSGLAGIGVMVVVARVLWGAVWSAIASVLRLMFNVVAFGLRVISGTFRALRAAIA